MTEMKCCSLLLIFVHSTHEVRLFTSLKPRSFKVLFSLQWVPNGFPSIRSSAVCEITLSRLLALPYTSDGAIHGLFPLPLSIHRDIPSFHCFHFFAECEWSNYLGTGFSFSWVSASFNSLHPHRSPRSHFFFTSVWILQHFRFPLSLAFFFMAPG